MPTPASRSSAVILFAHGARDRRWAEPFERVAERVRTAAPGLRIELAYLDGLQPDLASAVRTLAAEGAPSVKVVPLFFGRGGHLREDVPALIEQIRAALPGVSLELGDAAGEDAQVLDAIAAFCLRAAGIS